MLALSELADSAIEHYRGSFQNRAMYTPLVASTLTLGASRLGLAEPRAQRHVIRNSIYALAAATGFAELAFHTYNILKRPGGMSWLNLFYAAPVGAPAALALAGLLGRGAERVRSTPAGQSATVLGLPAGRTMAGVSAAGIAGTVGEAGLLHFRGAYHDPAMVLPVTVPPIAAALLGATAVRPTPRMNRITRGWLRLTALSRTMSLVPSCSVMRTLTADATQPGGRAFLTDQCCASSQRSASIAAMQPDPAAVIAWR